jgi:hypothetical protein
MDDKLVDKIAELCRAALAKILIQRESTNEMAVYMPAGRWRNGKGW